MGSAACAAVAHWLGPRAAGGRGAEEVSAINFAIMGTMLAIILVAFPTLFHLEVSAPVLATLGLVVLIDAAGNYFLFKTYRQSHPSVATPLLSLAPAFAFPLAWLFPLGQQASGLSILLGYIATFLVAAITVDWSNLGQFRRATFTPALLSSFCFGLSAVPVRYLLHEWHAMNAPTLYAVRAFLISGLFLAMWRRKAWPSLPPRQIATISARAIFVIAQYLLLYQALTLRSVGIALTLANLSPAFVFLGGILFLRQPWSWKQALPAILAIAAALLMSR